MQTGSAEEAAYTLMAHGQRFEMGRRELIGGLLDYAERYADLNQEPDEGDCRDAIRKGQAWFESGSAMVAVCEVGLALAVYVAKFAEVNGEPEQGDCRRLLQMADKAFKVEEAAPAGRKQVQEAKEVLIQALIEDQVGSYAGDSDCFKPHGRLAQLFRGGFEGFGSMSVSDLLKAARESGVARAQVDSVRILEEVA